MAVFLTCKNEKDPIKNEGARVLTRLYINFSDAQGQLTPQSVVESGRNSNKLYEDQIKNEGTSAHDISPNYKSMGIFSDAQGQLTPQSVVKSGPNLNLSKILCLSFRPVRMKKIGSKVKVLEC